MAFETNIVAEYEGDDIIFTLSDSLREFSTEVDGIAAWFILACTAGSYTEDSQFTDANMLANMLILGTVGDLGSGADLEIPNSEISASRTFKCGDLKFSIV